MLEKTNSTKYIPDQISKDEICKLISRMIQDELRVKTRHKPDQRNQVHKISGES